MVHIIHCCANVQGLLNLSGLDAAAAHAAHAAAHWWHFLPKPCLNKPCLKGHEKALFKGQGSCVPVSDC